MKKTYHLCLSAGEEVMFRDLEDYYRGFNCFAIALYKTGSTGLVESFMATHCHLMAETEDPEGLMYNMRMPYSKLFNNKYDRKGRFGEKHHFQMEVVGFHHRLAAACYTLRNAVHHGVAPIPYAYPHSSANSIFMREMGKTASHQLLPRKSFYRHIGRRAEYPDTYKMNESGLFIRESVLDIPQVENMFGTPRAFDYYMGRKTSEEWTKEQFKDNNNHPPVTLEEIEYGVNLNNTAQLLSFENGKADYRKISDIDLCRIIDYEILPTLEKKICISAHHQRETQDRRNAVQTFSFIGSTDKTLSSIAVLAGGKDSSPGSV